MVSFLLTWGGQTLGLFLESSTWLLVGFLAAGLLQAIGFTQYAQKFLIRPGFKSVFAASAIGIPLPLCSCSVIPVGVALRRKGASRGATASFFISTPQVGVDSFLLTIGLFGVPFGIARIIISFITALCAGVLIDNYVSSNGASETETKIAPCCSNTSEQSKPSSLSAYLKAVFDLLKDLRMYLFIGFVLAGLVSTLVSPESFETLFSAPSGSYLAAIFVGVPTYVCATSSTPLAAVLVAKGISAGAVLVFLLVGPATNIATIVALQKELSTKGVLLYLASIVVVAVLAGLMLDAFWPSMSVVETLTHEHHAYGVIDWLSAGVLIMLFLYTFIPSAPALNDEEH